MTKNSFMESERRSLDRMKKFQLPHTMKKVGFMIFLLFFITMFVNAFLIHDQVIKTTVKYGLLVSLLIVSISKEKIEDEFVTNLRMQSYSFAFILAVIYSLLYPFIDYIVDVLRQKEINGLKGLDDFNILWMLLFVQVFFFQYLKRMYK